jgi:hypothetical protein
VPRAIGIDAELIVPSRQTTLVVCAYAGGSSFLIWSTTLKDGQCGPVQKRQSHVFSYGIIHLSVSLNLNTVATITTAPSLVFSHLAERDVFCTVQLDAMPFRVKVTRNGLVLVVYTINNSARFDVFDINGRSLATTSIKGDMKCFDVASIGFGEDVLVVGFARKVVIVMKLFNLAEIARGELKHAPASISIGGGSLAVVTLRSHSVVTFPLVV